LLSAKIRSLASLCMELELTTLDVTSVTALKLRRLRLLLKLDIKRIFVDHLVA